MISPSTKYRFHATITTTTRCRCQRMLHRSANAASTIRMRTSVSYIQRTPSVRCGTTTSRRDQRVRQNVRQTRCPEHLRVRHGECPTCSKGICMPDRQKPLTKTGKDKPSASTDTTNPKNNKQSNQDVSTPVQRPKRCSLVPSPNARKNPAVTRLKTAASKPLGHLYRSPQQRQSNREHKNRAYKNRILRTFSNENQNIASHGIHLLPCLIATIQMRARNRWN